MEFEKLAFFLDSREMVPNLDYVAFSRVRNFKSLMIIDDRLFIDRVVMTGTQAKNWRVMQQVEEERLKQEELHWEFEKGI